MGRLRATLAQALGQVQDRLPEEVVEGEDKSGAIVAVLLQMLEDALDVAQVAEGVGQDNVVEGFAGLPQFRRQVKVLGIGTDKLSIGVLGSGDGDQFRCEVDPHALTGPHCCEQITRPTADFQDPGPGRDQESVQLGEIPMVVAVSLAPAIHVRGEAIET